MVVNPGDRPVDFLLAAVDEGHPVGQLLPLQGGDPVVEVLRLLLNLPIRHDQGVQRRVDVELGKRHHTAFRFGFCVIHGFWSGVVCGGTTGW